MFNINSREVLIQSQEGIGRSRIALKEAYDFLVDTKSNIIYITDELEKHEVESTLLSFHLYREEGLMIPPKDLIGGAFGEELSAIIKKTSEDLFTKYGKLVILNSNNHNIPRDEFRISIDKLDSSTKVFIDIDYANNTFLEDAKFLNMYNKMSNMVSSVYWVCKCKDGMSIEDTIIELVKCDQGISASIKIGEAIENKTFAMVAGVVIEEVKENG